VLSAYSQISAQIHLLEKGKGLSFSAFSTLSSVRASFAELRRKRRRETHHYSY